MRLCKYEQAVSYFDESIIKNPDNVGAITNKAIAYSKLGQLDLAIGYYDEALKIDPKYMPALNSKANALAQLGKFEDAISIYNAILDDDPAYAISQNNLQKTRENFVQYTKSQQEAQKAAPNVPLVQIDDTKTDNSDINHDTTKESKNFIDQIGNIFASFFGFLS
jgi:tetratricopeptide (TPR) repeat protein